MTFVGVTCPPRVRADRWRYASIIPTLPASGRFTQRQTLHEYRAQGGERAMGGFSIWHWLIVVVFLGGPVASIVWGVTRPSKLPPKRPGSPPAASPSREETESR